MNVNFFDSCYRHEPVKHDRLLGVCDPHGNAPAYTTATREGKDKWIAEIYNPCQIGVQFVAVDNNMRLHDDNGNQRKACDGMILYPLTSKDDKNKVSENVCFVELKDWIDGGWLTKATEQLKETIEIFNANHNYKDFRHREAYAVNRRHPRLNSAHKDKMQKFRNETHFRLIPVATIKIKVANG